MATAIKKTTKNIDTQALNKELFNVLLKKTGVSMEVLFETARKRFVASNLDLLTTTERKKYDPILLTAK